VLVSTAARACRKLTILLFTAVTAADRAISPFFWFSSSDFGSDAKATARSITDLKSEAYRLLPAKIEELTLNPRSVRKILARAACPSVPGQAPAFRASSRRRADTLHPFAAAAILNHLYWR
jgi:hypothetical protein